MAICSPTDIIVAAQCKNNLNPFFAEVYKTALYCRWKSHLESGTPLTCDIQELMDESACLFNFQIPILKVIQTQLLCDIKILLENQPSNPGQEWDVDSGQGVVDSGTGGPVISQD